MRVYLVGAEHTDGLTDRRREQPASSVAVEMIGLAGGVGARGGEIVAGSLVDGAVAEDGRVLELPDGFAVRAVGVAGSWNGFAVPVLGLVDALRVCLHVSEDVDPYLCSPLSTGGFLADGLQWQRRGNRLA